MLKLPVIGVTVTLNEIPNFVAVAIELGNCKQKCKNCHSPWTCENISKELWVDMTTLKAQVKKQLELGANAIVLMGGTNNGIKAEELVLAINELSKLADIGLYSGLENKALIHEYLKEYTNLRWLKTGAYKEHFGGLDNPKSNQHFYERIGTNWLDRTFLFRGENNASKA